MRSIDPAIRAFYPSGKHFLLTKIIGSIISIFNAELDRISVLIALRKLAFVGIASVSLAACGDFETVPLVQPGTQTGQVVFENPTTHPISSLQFNPCNTRVFGEPDFGDDRIDSSIPPGQSRQFTVSAGCYNLRAMTGGRGMFSMNNIEDFQVFSVQPGGTTTVRVRRQPLF